MPARSFDAVIFDMDGVRAARAAGCAVLGIASSQPAAVLLDEGALAVAADFTTVPMEVRAALGLE